jgi:hypothetical protein
MIIDGTPITIGITTPATAMAAAAAVDIADNSQELPWRLRAAHWCCVRLRPDKNGPTQAELR